MFSVLSLGSQSVITFSLLTAGIPDHTGTRCDSFTVEDGKQLAKRKKRKRKIAGEAEGDIGEYKSKEKENSRIFLCRVAHA